MNPISTSIWSIFCRAAFHALYHLVISLTCSVSQVLFIIPVLQTASKWHDWDFNPRLLGSKRHILPIPLSEIQSYFFMLTKLQKTSNVLPARHQQLETNTVEGILPWAPDCQRSLRVSQDSCWVNRGDHPAITFWSKHVAVSVSNIRVPFYIEVSPALWSFRAIPAEAALIHLKTCPRSTICQARSYRPSW